jgi:hypothetical protein
VPATIVIILGVQGLIMGVLDVIGGFQGGGSRSFLLGVLNIVIGAVLLASPLLAALSLPLVFGILLLIQGVGLILLAFRMHERIVAGIRQDEILAEPLRATGPISAQPGRRARRRCPARRSRRSPRWRRPPCRRR